MKQFLILAVLVSALPAFAQNSDPALKQVAATCFGCHGENGKSPNPLWPNLAGQKKEYLIKQINDFRNQKRKDPLMSPMSQTLTEAQIEMVANYFSSL